MNPSVFAFALVVCTSVATVARQNPVVITGVVLDAGDGSPVDDATLRLNGRDVGQSDERGRFRIGATLDPAASPHRITASRIGYTTGHGDFTLADETLTVEVVIRLQPVPVELEEINVEAEPVEVTTGRMAGFYRRRQNTPGHFFTREDIRKIGAQRLTEVVRRVPGTVIYNEDNTNTDPFNPNARPTPFEHPTRIQFQRSGFGRGAPCEPLLFINDVQVVDRNIDWFVQPNVIAGMEVYTSAAQVPAEYNKRGAGCGVIVIWTDGPLRSQGRASGRVMEVGAVVSLRMRNGFEGERFGVQLVVPLIGALEFHPNFNLIVGNTTEGDAGWQVLGALKLRPFGRNSAPYFGAGGSIIKNRTSFFQSQRGGSDETDTFLLGLAGVSIPVGPFRPFLEWQLADPLGRRDGYLATGLTIRHR